MDATETASALGAFTGAKFHAIDNLNNEFDKKKKEISRLKEELEHVKKEHEVYVVGLMKISEYKKNELEVKNASLQDEFLGEKTANVGLRKESSLA